MGKMDHRKFEDMGQKEQIKYLKIEVERTAVKLNFLIAVTTFIAVTIATATFRFIFGG